jgi:hypothetical protein
LVGENIFGARRDLLSASSKGSVVVGYESSFRGVVIRVVILGVVSAGVCGL